jgi:hypothetical protein
MTLYKATDVQGRSFHDPAVTWAVGEVTTHPTSTAMVPNYASTYLSASSEPADCNGFVWPCRLFEVEPVGEVLDGMDYPNKRAALAFRVVRELPGHDALGPNGAAVAAFILRCKRLTPDEARKLGAAWDAARAAARAAAGAAARAAAWDAAWDAAGALLVQDKIAPEQFDTLTKPWRDAGLDLA